MASPWFMILVAVRNFSLGLEAARAKPLRIRWNRNLTVRLCLPAQIDSRMTVTHGLWDWPLPSDPLTPKPGPIECSDGWRSSVLNGSGVRSRRAETLQQQARLRFGGVPKKRARRVLAADGATLNRWFNAPVTAENPETVFSSHTSHRRIPKQVSPPETQDYSSFPWNGAQKRTRTSTSIKDTST